MFVACIVILMALLGSSDACNCVAMRMDDIQDWWLTQTQIDVINVFKDENVPLTSLIIGKDFGQDSTIVNPIKNFLQYSKTSGWDFEVGCHGYSHDDFSKQTLSVQTSWLSSARTATLKTLKGYVTDSEFISFVPPYNGFNANTIAAAKATGYKIVSAGVSGYVDINRPFPGSDPSVREFPMQASTTDLSDTYKISSQETVQYVKTQIANYGFSVLMMHFYEFSTNDATDPTLIADLKNLIKLLRQEGITMTSMRGLNKLYYNTSSSVTPSATTGPVTKAATTKAATTKVVTTKPLTTARVSSVTTGVKQATTGAKPVTTGVQPITTGVQPITTGVPQQATTGAVTTQAPTTPSSSAGCNCIAFKLEQIQDYYLGAASAAILSTFTNANVPLSLGIIPYYFGEDSSVVNPVKAAVAACKAEVGISGYMYEDFSSQSLTKQQSLLDSAISKTKSILGITPKVFFPPMVSFNSNTMSALASRGFKWISAVVDTDPAPYNTDNPSVWRFPAGAYTADLVTGAPQNLNQVSAQAQAQLNSNGFAVVMLTPREYSTASGAVNQSMINQLNAILNTAKASGKKIVFVSQMSAYYGGPASDVTCALQQRRVMEEEEEYIINQPVTKDSVKKDVSNNDLIFAVSGGVFVVFAVVAAVVMVKSRITKRNVETTQKVESDPVQSANIPLVRDSFGSLKKRTASSMVAQKV